MNHRTAGPGAVAIAMALLLAPPSATTVAAGAMTTRVSVSSAGKQARSWSGYPSISANGRWIAFETGARNLVKGDTNGESDVFVRDRTTGKTERVSVGSSGLQGNDWSGYASISGDGRFVTFTAEASNLVEGDSNGVQDVFVRDRATGTTERVSVSSSGEQGDAASAYSAISADGRFVAFTSSATNLVSGDDNGQIDVFLHDRAFRTTRRISVSSSGEQGNGSSDELMPTGMSADGRHVTFSSTASNLVDGDTNGVRDVFVHDRRKGTTIRASASTSGAEGSASSGVASLSADGRFVVFESAASNLVAGDTNGREDVFIHNVRRGITRRVSVGQGGVQADGYSQSATISADGRFVAFESSAENLVGNDGNQARDVFLRDRKKGKTRRLSVGSEGVEGDRSSSFPYVSASGRFVAFQSDATNLVAGDTNEDGDVYLRGPIP